MRIAFAGNPSSGKTTMYNALTGRNEKVGNWAGVTVDKKEALLRRLMQATWNWSRSTFPVPIPCLPSLPKRALPAAMLKTSIPMPSLTSWTLPI